MTGYLQEETLRRRNIATGSLIRAASKQGSKPMDAQRSLGRLLFHGKMWKFVPCRAVIYVAREQTSRSSNKFLGTVAQTVGTGRLQR